ncbi:hypothetical protein BDP67DRAFT_28047 [Colletotrichum lupini]|nr:hypothetical protein BDP67DRAFT_28047 [Colletotrichum lupini]
MRMPLCSFFFSFPHSLFSLRGVLLLPLSLSVGFCSRCSSALTDVADTAGRGLSLVAWMFRPSGANSRRCRSRCLLCAMSPSVEHSVARAGRLESESVPIETLVLAIGVSCAGRSVGQFEGVEAEVRRLGERKVEEVGCTRAELYFTGLRGTHERTGVLETTPREKRSRASSRPCRVDGFQAARLMGIRRQGWWKEHHGTDCCERC